MFNNMLTPRKVNPNAVTNILGTIASGKEADIISRGRELEKRGRMIAVARNQLIGEEDRKWFCDMSQWHDELAYSEVTYGLFEIGILEPSEYEGIRNLRNAPQAILQSVEFVFPSTDSPKRHKAFPRSTSLETVLKEYYEGEEADTKHTLLILGLEGYDYTQSQYTGKSGIWLYGTVPLEKYTYSAYVNDYTSCFHVFLDWLSMKISHVDILFDKVYGIKPYDPYLINNVALWYKATQILRKEGVYFENDADALSSIVHGNEAEMRVGSSPGHAVHIESRILGLTGTYYDTDESVNDIVMRLVNFLGGRVLEYNDNESVSFFFPRGAERELFIGLLPFTTSMDIRIKIPMLWCRGRWKELLDKIYPKSSSGKEAELQMCYAVGRQLLEEVGL